MWTKATPKPAPQPAPPRSQPLSEDPPPASFTQRLSLIEAHLYRIEGKLDAILKAWKIDPYEESQCH